MPESPLVLIVEDEFFLQADLEAVLTDGGFASKSIATGEEAVALFMDGKRLFSALVTDVNLGNGIDGWEVAKRLRQREPTLPVIYVTASPAEEWALKGVPGSVLVSKPFARTRLLAELSKLLNGRSSPT